MYFLNSYKPLCYTKEGQTAINQFGLPSFIDASCRREPDFESKFPSISALCRVEKFAPRLNVDDYITYMTVKGIYKPEAAHRRLVAILKVLHRFENHTDAAVWYQERDLPIPSNCMVAGNNCMPYEMTGGAPKEFLEVDDIERKLRRWDRNYKLRMKQCSTFLVCDTEFKELNTPPILSDEKLISIFGKVPGTQNPPQITENQFIALHSVL